MSKKLKLRVPSYPYWHRNIRKQYRPADRFYVYHSQKRMIIEAHFDLTAARSAAKVLNRHESGNLRPGMYQIAAVDQVEILNINKENYEK